MEAALVIDVQSAIVRGAFQEQRVLDAIATALGRVRDRDGLVIFVQHCHSTFEPLMKGRPGWELDPRLDVRSGDLRIEKTASDSFYKTSLADELRTRDVEHLFVMGLQTEFCVDATCRAALSHDFAVTLIEDGHTTGDSHLAAAQVIEHHNRTLPNLAHPSLSIRTLPASEI